MVATKGSRLAGYGGASKGTCPVCRGMFKLNINSGKLGVHGRSAASPRGCPGGGSAPMSRRELQQSAEVSVLHPGVPAAGTEQANTESIDVIVERRGEVPDAGVTMRPPPPEAS
jgi:hypothetical protein